MKKFIYTGFVVFLSLTPLNALALTSADCAGYGSNFVLSSDGTTCVASSRSSTPNSPIVVTNGSGSGSNTNGTNLGYTPLEPIPGLTTGANLIDPNSLPDIINAAFKIFITVGALFAVLMLTIGGIQYMISGGPSEKLKGIKRAQAAVFGMVLLAAVYLILFTINPNLLRFNLKPCPDGINCSVTQTQINQNNTSSSASSPIPGLPVDQTTCTNINDAQSVSGNLLNDGAFYYSVRSSIKVALPVSWGGMTAAQQAQADKDYLAACAQNKFL